MSRLVGARVSRVEDDRLLTGAGAFVGDVGRPGLLHAAFVRSPIAHARLGPVDVAAARAAPGVAAVLTAADLVGRAGPLRLGGPPALARPAYRALADDKVRYVGDPVALVVAASRALAEDAAEQVEVGYDPLPPVVTLAAALDPAGPVLFDEVGTNVVYREHRDHGDPDRAFARADQVVTLTFRQFRQANAPMEGRGGVADYTPATGELVYHAAHQNPHALHVDLATLLDLPVERVQVLCGDIGGSFGQKAYVSREDVAVAAAAVALGRPVAWIEDRSENLLAAGHARDEELTVDAAITADGVVLGLAVRMTLDQGAYQLSTLPSTVVPTIVRVLLPGPYRIEHLRFDATIVATNKATYVAYRGPWEAETWVRERLLDVIARRLDLEPVEVRRRNLLQADDFPRRMATGPTMESVTAAETLERAVAEIDLPAFRVEQRAARRHGRHLGFGLATYVEPAPGPPDYGAAIGAGAAPRTAQRAVARLERDGTVTVLTSQSPHGQGHQTTLAQLAADRFDVGLDAVQVVHGDTRRTPFHRVGTGGSRAATLASGAVLGAVDDLAGQALRVTGRALEASPDDLELRAGRVQVRGTPGAGRTLAEVAALADAAAGPGSPAAPRGLEATFDFAIPDGGWSQATHCAWVAVDVDTGLVEISRYLVVEDCGAMINPAVVEGQIRGGVAQGIGGVLYEWFAYGEDGQPRTASFVDYLLPTAAEIPRIDIVHVESPPQGPVDFRGVGEGGAIGAPAALTNAIEDALAPFGVTVTDQYLPPTRILELIGRLG